MKIHTPRPETGALLPGLQPARGGAVARPDVAAPPLGLTPGQLVKGAVIGPAQDGGVLLLIDGQLLEARSEIPLQPGSELWLEVRRTEPLWLGTADRKGAVQEFLRQYFADPAAMGRGLHLLLETLQTDSGPEVPGGLAEIAQVLDNASLGASADPGRLLRSLTLLLPSHGSQPGGAGVTRLSELAMALVHADKGMGKGEQAVLQRFAAQVELQAQLATLPPPADQAALLLVPCLFSMDAGWGQWLLAMDRQAGREKEGEVACTLSFFLEMSRLGEVQLQARIKGKALHAEMVVADDQVRHHVEGLGQELIESLGSLGYGPVSFTCRKAKLPGMLAALKERLQEAVGLEGVPIVDLRA